MSYTLGVVNVFCHRWCICISAAYAVLDNPCLIVLINFTKYWCCLLTIVWKSLNVFVQWHVISWKFFDLKVPCNRSNALIESTIIISWEMIRSLDKQRRNENTQEHKGSLVDIPRACNQHYYTIPIGLIFITYSYHIPYISHSNIEMCKNPKNR